MTLEELEQESKRPTKLLPRSCCSELETLPGRVFLAFDPVSRETRYMTQTEDGRVVLIED